MSCDSPQHEAAEGPPGRLKKGKKCGGCKGKKPCAKCSAAKAMKEDALTTQEYLAACDLGVEHKSRNYIRARLDASGKSIKCGNSHIPAGRKCRKGGGGAMASKGEDMSKYSAKGTAKRGAIVGSITGALLGATAGGGLRGALRGAAVGGAVGATAGATRAGINRAGRAWKRSGENMRKAEPEIQRLGRAYDKQMGQARAKDRAAGKGRRIGLSTEMAKVEERYAAKVGNAYDKQQTNIWSNANEKTYKRGQTPYDKARKAGKAR